MDSDDNILEFLIILVLGIAMLLFGISGLRSDLKLKNKCTEAISADIVSIQSQGYKKKVLAEFRFEYGGEAFTATADVESSFNRKYNAGESVTLNIDPNDPETFYIKGTSSSFWEIVFTVMGAVFSLVGMIYAKDYIPALFQKKADLQKDK